ncbi:MAG TPA: hypothetical protein DD434_01050 [Bacteroidales bacterium]|nr:hypothetical protein [Bacteroidales bacterium]
MNHVKIFKHVLLFDKYSINKEITNDSNSILSLLDGSPVVYVNNPNNVIGYAADIEYRSFKNLYYGNIYLFDKLYKKTINKISVSKTELAYKYNDIGNITITSFITNIK